MRSSHPIAGPLRRSSSGPSSSGGSGLRLAEGSPTTRNPGAGPGRLFLSAWCRWGSCGDSGRGCVQICHKGTPGRDWPRRKARNINVSSRALRLGRGLCGRFGQSAASDRSGRASAGRAAGGVVAPTTAVTTSTAPSGPWEHRPGRTPAPGPVPGCLARTRAPPRRPRSYAFAEERPAQERPAKNDGPGAANRPQDAPPPPPPRRLPDEEGLDAPRRPRNNLPGSRPESRVSSGEFLGARAPDGGASGGPGGSR